MVPSQSTTVVADGLKKLTDAFKNKANVNGILKSLLGPFQDLENVIFDVVDAMQNPTGDMLTRRARIVGEERNGRSDADLLTAFKLRILANNSQGLSEDLLRLANNVNPSLLYEGGISSWFIETSNLQASPTTLAELLGEAKRAASYGALSYSIWSSTLDFTWGDSASSSVWGPGWGDSGGGYTGGLLYSLQEAKGS